MNVLTIYLPWGKLPVASNLRIVKTAVCIVVNQDRFVFLKKKITYLDVTLVSEICFRVDCEFAVAVVGEN
jgi:hypothetical protein